MLLIPSQLSSIPLYSNAEKPAPPSPPGFEHIRARSLHIVWKPRFDGNSPITKFKIEYKQAIQTSIWEVKEVNGSVRSLELTSLKPAVDYILQIYAVNKLGTSRASDQKRVRTKEDGEVFFVFFSFAKGTSQTLSKSLLISRFSRYIYSQLYLYI